MNMIQKLTIGCAICLTATIGAGIAILANAMSPIQWGTPEKFWNQACQVNMGQTDTELGFRGNVRIVNQLCFYELTHLHGSKLYKVKTSDAMKSWDAVQQCLDNRVQRHDPNDLYATAYSFWKNMPEKERGGIEGLLSEIESERLLDREKRSPSSLITYGLDEYTFDRRLQQAKWYWANIVFEFVFLCGFVWFLFWPLIRKKGLVSYLIRTLFGPILFMLPYYLGYAQFTYTSVGPSGGILYPWLLILFRRGIVSHIDRIILDYLPQILEPLSQGIGSPMVLSGMGFWGPTYVFGFGIGLSFILLILSVIKKRKFPKSICLPTR
jgi:hypothetical protein